MSKEKVRINVQISQEAYAALLQMAGGERSMGKWLSATILFLYSYELKESAVESLTMAKEFLDEYFERKENK